MYDLPGRVNNLYKEPQFNPEIQPEEPAEYDYPPACEMTRATGNGTLAYCNSIKRPYYEREEHVRYIWIAIFVILFMILTLL